MQSLFEAAKKLADEADKSAKESHDKIIKPLSELIDTLSNSNYVNPLSKVDDYQFRAWAAVIARKDEDNDSNPDYLLLSPDMDKFTRKGMLQLALHALTDPGAVLYELYISGSDGFSYKGFDGRCLDERIARLLQDLATANNKEWIFIGEPFVLSRMKIYTSMPSRSKAVGCLSGFLKK